ncbi:hypothetical protein MBLNU459_g0679t2 [Dothideomycetes sp. NU459]
MRPTPLSYLPDDIPATQHYTKSELSDFADVWSKKRLTPHQLLVHDVRLEHLRPNSEPRLEILERVATDLVPQSAVRTLSSRLVRAADAARNPIERQRLTALEEEYGWMAALRIRQVQQNVFDSDRTAKLRWV